MRVLVTGANGMLVHDLLPLLEEKGWEFKALTREELDITRLEQVQQALQKYQPEVLINGAAYTQVDRAETEKEAAYAVNELGSKNLAIACSAQNIKLAHVSTDFVFDGTQQKAYIESVPASPIGIYGQSKYAGEQAIQEHSSDFIIVRTSWLYGVSGGNFVKTMLRLGKERDELGIVHDQIGSPTWTHDLANALIHLIEAQASGIFHYSNSGQCSWFEFTQQIMATAHEIGLLDKTPALKPITTADYPTPAQRPAFSVLNCEKYTAITQHPCPPWQDSLKHMLTALKGQGTR